MALDLADKEWPHKAQQILLRRDVLMTAADEIERLVAEAAPKVSIVDTGA